MIKLSVELLVRKKMRLKKNNVYIVRFSENAKAILEDLKILGENFVFERSIHLTGRIMNRYAPYKERRFLNDTRRFPGY